MAAMSARRAVSVPISKKDAEGNVVPAKNSYEAFVNVMSSDVEGKDATLRNIWRRADMETRKKIEEDYPGTEEEYAGGRRRRKTKKSKRSHKKTRKHHRRR